MAARPMAVHRPRTPAKPASMLSAVHSSACRHSCARRVQSCISFALQRLFERQATDNCSLSLPAEHVRTVRSCACDA